MKKENEQECSTSAITSKQSADTNQQLLSSMELCGHFLYHRRGGKRGQRRILHILYDNQEITQKRLLDILDIQAGSLSETVIKLEDRGLITRSRDPKDRRNMLLQITEAGKKEYEKMLQISKNQEMVLFQALTNEEQKELNVLLDKLINDWNENFKELLVTHRKGDKRC